MKIISKILFIFFVLIIPLNTIAVDNVNINSLDNGTSNRNDALNEIKDSSIFFNVSSYGEKGIKGLLFNIARDLRIIVFIMILLIGIIMVFNLLFGNNSEEEASKFRKGVIWCTVGIIVIQIPFTVYSVIFDRDVDADLATNIESKIIQPFIDMLMLLASFFFIAMAIYSFYRITTANGDEEKIKNGKTIIFQSIIGFIVIKLADTIIRNTYNVGCNSWMGITSNCTQTITKNAEVITDIINWVNSFIALVVVLMLIYAGFLIVTGGNDEDKQKKAKNILLYSGIGLLILFASYLILTFFIIPESNI